MKVAGPVELRRGGRRGHRASAGLQSLSPDTVGSRFDQVKLAKRDQVRLAKLEKQLHELHSAGRMSPTKVSDIYQILKNAGRVLNNSRSLTMRRTAEAQIRRIELLMLGPLPGVEILGARAKVIGVKSDLVVGRSAVRGKKRTTRRGHSGPRAPSPPPTIPPSIPPTYASENPEAGAVPRVLDVEISGGPILADKVIFLTAAIILPNSAASGQWQQQFGFDPALGPVTFVVNALGFHFLTEDKAVAEVQPDGTTKRVAFQLRVLSWLERWICLTLFQAGYQLAQITLNDFLKLESGKTVVRKDVGITFSADLTLIAKSNSDTIDAWSNKYKRNSVPMAGLKIPDDAIKTHLRDVISSLYDSRADPEDQETELKLIGSQLRKCLPSDLITLFAQNDLKSVCIQHDKEFDFPFELCWFDELGGFFLGDRVAVCRWFLGTASIPPSTHDGVKRVAVLKGRSAVTSLAIDSLRSVWPDVAVFSTTKQVVDNILKRDEYDILHFIGHCKSAGGRVYLELEKGRLDLIRIGELKEEQVFGDRAPFVTLHGCSTAASYLALFEKDSFAHRFVEAHACGVLATLWPVDGHVANAFSQLFYENVFEGQSVTNALLAAKSNLLGAVERRTPGLTLNPVAIKLAARSYCMFSNPDLKLRLAA